MFTWAGVWNLNVQAEDVKGLNTFTWSKVKGPNVFKRACLRDKEPKYFDIGKL